MSYFLNSIDKKNEFTLMYTEDYFVDKTGLISKLNARVNKKERFVCINVKRKLKLVFRILLLELNPSLSDLYERGFPLN